ncbi:hypothetical protein [Runella sp.]|uniref:hypothetical protein n=1 Tax=Runella sp. TaxID=1960881 RepID=UPI003D0981FE
MKILNVFAAVIVLIIAFLFYRFVDQNAVNVPFFDDYAYLEYIIKFINAPDVLHFLQELEFKHNGHGVITAKSVFWLDYLLTGEANYRTLILAGSGLVILLFWYFWNLLAANRMPFWYSLPIALFLFTPAYHENIFWAAALWQYTASFAIGLWTYYVLTKENRWAFAMAVAGGFLLTYTNGNGLFGMYVGVIIPLLQTRYKRVAVWLIACIITTIIFYWYYPFGFGSLGQEKSLKNSLLTIVSFFGSCASYFRGRLPEVAVLGGLITFLLIGLALWLAVEYIKKIINSRSQGKILPVFTKHSVNLSLLSLLAWLLVTGLGVATARAGNALETPARYMIYSVMAVVSLYVAFLLLLPQRMQKIIAAGMIPIGGFFVLSTYMFASPDVINFRNSLISDAFSLGQHRRVTGKLETMTNSVVKKYFDEALKKGIYVLPTTVLNEADLVTVDSSAPLKVSLKVYLDTLPAYGGILINKVSSERLGVNHTKQSDALFMLLKKDSVVYATAVKQRPNRERNSFLRTGNYFKEGFEAWVFQDNVPEGDYQVGFLFNEGEKPRVVYTPQHLIIQDFQK